MNCNFCQYNVLEYCTKIKLDVKPDFGCVYFSAKKAEKPETLLDEDGYPTDELLAYLYSYIPCDEEPLEGFLEMLEEIWAYSGWGMIRKQGQLELHTAGWSGNESIIDAIQANRMLRCFMRLTKWNRGGHYFFDIP